MIYKVCVSRETWETTIVTVDANSEDEAWDIACNKAKAGHIKKWELDDRDIDVVFIEEISTNE